MRGLDTDLSWTRVGDVDIGDLELRICRRDAGDLHRGHVGDVTQGHEVVPAGWNLTCNTGGDHADVHRVCPGRGSRRVWVSCSVAPPHSRVPFSPVPHSSVCPQVLPPRRPPARTCTGSAQRALASARRSSWPRTTEWAAWSTNPCRSFPPRCSRTVAP